MKLGRGWIEALAIWTALGLTGCGAASEYGDSSDWITEESSMEETVDVPSKAEDDEEEISRELLDAAEETPQTASKGTEETSQAEADLQESGTKLTFSLGGDASMMDLPQEVVDQIAAINTGEPPAGAVGMDELKSFYALIATHTIIGKDAETGEEVTGSGKLTFYVPNLLEGLEDVSVLFYDKAAGQWEILPVEQLDTEARTVSVMLTGSGVLTVIYRRQE